MENYSYPTYPDSGHSSPRSREIDCENASWDEPSSVYKVKFMCSYGGKIHPRPHDNQLTYVGGETKILSVDRNIKFSGFISRLSSLCDADVCFKYQLPGEDLDALISVTNDEDLEHMMLEYDRLCRASAKPARLRIFLFPANPAATSPFGSNDSKSERQWFVDALNSVQIQPLEPSSPPAVAGSEAANPDFLFGFDKRHLPHAPPDVAAKLENPPSAPAVPDAFPRETHGGGSDCGSEDRHFIVDPMVSPAEFQRQIQEFQRSHVSSNDRAVFQRKPEEMNPRAPYTGEIYPQKVPEKPQPVQQQVPVQIPMTYWQDRHMTTGGYPVGPAPGTEQQVYFIPAQTGGYQPPPAMRPVTGPVGQAYYGVQRVAPEVYREQPVYSAVPQQQPNMGAYTEAMQMVRPQLQPQPQPQPQGGPGGVEHGYAQVSYDGLGRQVYYTAQGGVVQPQYQGVTPAAAMVDVRQAGQGAYNQEGVKVVGKAPQTSSM